MLNENAKAHFCLLGIDGPWAFIKRNRIYARKRPVSASSPLIKVPQPPTTKLLIRFNNFPFVHILLIKIYFLILNNFFFY